MRRQAVPGAIATGSNRLERNRPGCSVTLNDAHASEDACAPVPVVTAPGSDFISRYCSLLRHTLSLNHRQLTIYARNVY